MTSTPTAAPPSLRPALAAAAGLAGAMGVGRFAFTPLLPVMVDAQRLGPGGGAVVATANYAGYLLGAVLLARRPRWETRTALWFSAVALVASEILMAVPAPTAVAATLRLVAGVASAFVFVGCANAMSRYDSTGRGAGIAFGGVGFGIALTGVLVLSARSSLTWQELWIGSAVLTAVLLVPVLSLETEPGAPVRRGTIRAPWAWRALLAAYFLEGAGYIVIGTFLVAAVSAQRGATLGSSVWIVAGAAAVPSTLLWVMLARRTSPVIALPIALVAQCFSALLPAVTDAPWALVTAAGLFGATFMGIVMLAIRVGADLADGPVAATLTACYGAGQMLGPLAAAPLLGHGYTPAFTLATLLIIAATLSALAIPRLHRAAASPSAPVPSPV